MREGVGVHTSKLATEEVGKRNLASMHLCPYQAPTPRDQEPLVTLPSATPAAASAGW